MGKLDVRGDLEAIKSSAEAGNLEEVVQRVNHALRALDENPLLTTTEAARLLDIRSVNTLKLLVRRLGVPHQKRGNRMMLPLSALEDLQQHQLVRGIRASDQAHDATDALGSSTGLTQEQMDALAAERPGTTPWQRIISTSHE